MLISAVAFASGIGSTTTVTRRCTSPGSWCVRSGANQTAVWSLQAISPAVDGGNPGGCKDSHNTLIPGDQRSYARTVDGNNDGSAICDIGAFELALVRLFLPLVWR